ncbi:MAG: hypothetical protein ACTSUO_06385 [Candidatus Thorarchaeota archaeon]
MKKGIIILLVLICISVQPSIMETSAQSTYTVVFDWSHGQYSTSMEHMDLSLAANLTAMGYNVVFATGGLNDSVLSTADALILGAIMGEENGFSQNETNSISTWFESGNKLFWMGCDSDYGGQQYINDNASAVLSSVGSHVYPEPIEVADAQSCCGASYRVVANTTSEDAFVADIVENVSAVLMHGPTCLYGSSSGDGQNPVDLRETTITNVYPVLYYGDAAKIVDSDITPPLAHYEGEQGGFVAMTIETYAGSSETGVIIVSGASPYGDYRSMYEDLYYDIVLDGYNLVLQAIDFGVETALNPTTTTPTTETTTSSTSTSDTTTSTDSTSPTTVFELIGSLPMMITIGSAGVIIVVMVLICRARE